MRRVEKIREDIIGLQPVYTETGDATVIYLHEGELRIDRGIRSVIAALARSYGIDLSAQRQGLEERLQRHGVMPLYLAEDRVFIPVKMRKAVARKDVVYGYLDVRSVGDIAKRDDCSCTVAMSGGRQLEILSKHRTVVNSHHMGQQLLALLQKEKTGDPGETMAVGVTVHYYKTLQGIVSRLEEVHEILKEGRREYLKRRKGQDSV